MADRGPFDAHVERVGAEAFAGDLERPMGARRVLVEEVDEGAPRQKREFLVRAAALLDVTVGEIEERRDVGAREALDAEKMAVRENGVCARAWARGSAQALGRSCH